MENVKDKLKDVRSLIFEGFLKETVTINNDLVVVIRTLSLAEENFVVESYENLSDNYNLLAALDTLQKSIYSINGCRITKQCSSVIRDWPRQIVVKLFNIYLKLTNRARETIQSVKDFIKTDESRLRWSVIKMTNTSLNSATITGNTEWDSKGLSYVQQIWIFLNQQNDSLEQNKLDWSRVEYMTDSICSFVNPKAMRQIQNKKKLLKDEEEQKQRRENIQEMQANAKDKVMIENSADDLFDSLARKENESPQKYRERVSKSLVKAFTEDEHDRIVREHEEYLFSKRLRIKKENARRSKLLYERRKADTVINMPKRKDINVAFEMVSTIGTNEELSNAIQHEEKTNSNFVNGINYSDIVSITSFSMLKNKNKIFNEIVNESDEETEKWIKLYIEEEEDKDKSEVFKHLTAINKNVMSSGNSNTEVILNRREDVLTAGNNRFEIQQDEMKSQIQEEQDEIGFR